MKNASLILFFVCLTTIIYCQDETTPKTESELHWEEMSSQVEVLFYKGSYVESAELAKDAYDYALENFDKDHLFIANSLDNLGTVLHHAGKPLEGQVYLEQAVEKTIALLGKEDEDYSYVSRANNLAMLYKDIGAFHKAIPLFTDALEISRTKYGKDHPSYAVLLNNQSILFQNMGLYDQALENAFESLQVTEQNLGKAHRKYGIRLASLGSIYMHTDQAEKALPYLLEALEVTSVARGKDHPSVSRVIRVLADCHLELGQPNEAIKLIQRGLAIDEERLGKDHRHYLYLLGSLANAHKLLGEHELALLLFKEILERRERMGDKNLRYLILPYLDLARQYELMADTDKSIEMFRQLLSKQKIIRSYYNFFSETEQLAMLKNRENISNYLESFVLRQPDAAELAYEYIILNKDMSLRNTRQMLNTLRTSTDKEFNESLQDWEQLKQEIAQAYGSPSKHNIDSLEQKSNELEGNLARQSAEFSTLNKDIRWQDIQNKLKEGEVAIEFSHFTYFDALASFDSTIYVAYILKKDVDFVKTVYLCNDKELGNLKNLRSLYAMEKRDGFPNLNELLIQPLQAELKDIHTIYYASSGLLHRINLNAIPFDDNEILSERFAMHKLGSTRELLTKTAPKNPSINTGILYGGIQYDSSPVSIKEDPAQNTSVTTNLILGNAFRSLRNDGWEPLNWTETEVEKASKSLHAAGFQTTVKKGHEATEDFIKEVTKQATSPKVLHFATHAYFFPENNNQLYDANPFESSRHPMIRSGLILAGANEVWQGEPSSATEDGILTAYEIAQMDLSNTELVVLSACETGLGDINNTEGVFGLQRAFKMAGAKHIIMSLWSIKDKQTQEFMSDFYQIWLNTDDPKTIPQAFQQAQLKLRTQYAKPFNPYLWAGFILME